MPDEETNSGVVFPPSGIAASTPMQPFSDAIDNVSKNPLIQIPQPTPFNMQVMQMMREMNQEIRKENKENINSLIQKLEENGK